MHFDSEVDAGIWLFAGADAIEPIFLVVADPFSRQKAVENFHVNFVGKRSLGNQLNSRAAQASHFQRAVMASDHFDHAVFVDRCAGEDEVEAAGEFGDDLDAFIYVALVGSRRIAIGLPGFGSQTDDAAGKFWIAGSQDERMRQMRQQVSQKPGAVGEVFAPTKVVIGVEWDFLVYASHPAIPMNVIRSGPFFDQVVPFSFWVVPHVGGLPHNQRTDGAALDDFGCFVIFFRTATLGTNLKQASGSLHGVVNGKGFTEVTGQRFLHVNVPAGFHGVDGDLGVPVIYRGNTNSVNVFAFQ